MRIVVLISILMVIAILLTTFGIFNIEPMIFDNTQIYVNSFYFGSNSNFLFLRHTQPIVYNNSLYDLYYSDVLRLDKRTNSYYDFGYLCFLKPINSENSDFRSSVYVTTSNVIDSYNLGYFDYNLFIELESPMIFSYSNGNYYLVSEPYNYTYYGFYSTVKSLQLVWSSSVGVPQLDNSNLLSLFSYVFVDFPTFIYNLIYDFVHFVVGGQPLWVY